MNKNTSTTSAVVWLLLLAVLSTTYADAQIVPPLVNYQGKLVNSNGVSVSTGDYQLRFHIYDAATNGNLIWGPQVFNGQTGPGYGQLVPVVQGWFNVILGPVDTNAVAIANAFNNTNRFIEISVGTNLPVLPRQQILSAPYAFRASHADTADTASNVQGFTTTGPIALYVSTNGLDQNDGLSRATAKRTIQAAIDTIPNDVRHSIRIVLAPGTYIESVNVRSKRGTVGSMFPIVIEGIATNSTLVRLDGQGGTALVVQASGLEIYGVTITNRFGSPAHIYGRSDVHFTSCNLDMTDALLIQGYSSGSCGDCVFRSSNPGTGGDAIYVNQMSYWRFANNISITGYTRGIVVRHGSVVTDWHLSPVNISGTTTPSDVDQSSHYFSSP